MSEYRLKFYINPKTGESPILSYLRSLEKPVKLKIGAYLEYLRDNDGYMEEPRSKHIVGKIRELRVDFGRNRHRLFYFTFIKKTILVLHAFQKSTAKTPRKEIDIALNRLEDATINKHIYE